MKKLTITLAFVATLVAAGCGGTKPEPTADCRSVPVETVELLTRHLTAHGVGTLRDAQAVRSSWVTYDDPAVAGWFVSAELDAPGLEDNGDVATWYITASDGDLTAPRTIAPAEGMAREFSDWLLDPFKEAPGVVFSLEGFEESQDCVAAAQS